MASIAQKIKQLFYPLIMRLTKATTKGRTLHNAKEMEPVQPFYELSATLNNSKPLNFNQLKGKKVLLVNTASDCGFTGQFAELQTLYKQNENKLAIIGFPSNDFKEQEKADDAAISQFCQVNYGVTFPLAKKSVVVKGTEQNAIFHWLSSSNKNGWNDQQPDWNFSKYLINENGLLTDYFGPAISPLDTVVINAINK